MALIESHLGQDNLYIAEGQIILPDLIQRSPALGIKQLAAQRMPDDRRPREKAVPPAMVGVAVGVNYIAYRYV